MEKKYVINHMQVNISYFFMIVGKIELLVVVVVLLLDEGDGDDKKLLHNAVESEIINGIVDDDMLNSTHMIGMI
jgi:hypothetical protein